jgi:hypothetical protein
MCEKINKTTKNHQIYKKKKISKYLGKNQNLQKLQVLNTIRIVEFKLV